MSDSKPLMFIDSIQEINEAKKETQKNVSLNRIDDIKAMLYYKKTTPNPAILAVHINFPDFHKSVPAI